MCCCSAFGKFICSLNPFYKEPVIVPNGCKDLGMLLQDCRFGDILLFRTSTKLDSAVSISSYIASDIALAAQSSCLVPETVQFSGWDHAALVIKDLEISKHEYFVLEIDRWGFHSYELLERIRYHERQGNKIGILSISVEIQDKDEIYKQLVKPFLDITHKRAIEKGSEIIDRVFKKIKAYASQVDLNTKLYKEYQRKFRFFLQGETTIFPGEVKTFLKHIVDDYLPMERVEEFIAKNNQILQDKGMIDFDFLYTLMKPDLLSYKSFYEINLDSVVSAEILIQFLFALGVVKLPEYVEHITVIDCDKLVDLSSGIPNIEFLESYRYSPILEYYEGKHVDLIY